jgi:hypothetical protein
MSSPPRIAANRRNAVRSTGPLTAAGKIRASRNARKHGLSISIRNDPSISSNIEALAVAIAGKNATPRQLQAARGVAEAHLELRRLQEFKLALIKIDATSMSTTRNAASNISGLKQAALERDSYISGLKQAVLERDSNISGLKQAVLERDSKIVNLENSFGTTERQLKDSLHRIKAIEESHSWRVTAPYRAIGAFVRRGIGAFKGSQIINRILVANLLLPAAFVYYGGLWGVVRALRRQQQFFATVIGNQAVIRDRLLHRARWYRRLILVNFSLAIRIHRAGSFLRSMRDFILIMQSEGRGGLRHRLITTIPNMLPRSQPTSVVVIADALTADLARRILVADYRIPRADVSAGERATEGILKDLCALGYEVVFLPNDMAPSAHEEAELQALGIKVADSSLKGNTISPHWKGWCDGRRLHTTDGCGAGEDRAWTT